MQRAPEPEAGDERELLLGWLAFHRDALAAKCSGLTPRQLAAASAQPSELSLLGLVRHLTEMERVYLVHALDPDPARGPLRGVYRTDEDPDADIAGGRPNVAVSSMERWHRERASADALLGAAEDLDARAPGNRLPVRWNLIKIIQEYARHNGHADLIRERIDGATGE